MAPSLTWPSVPSHCTRPPVLSGPITRCLLLREKVPGLLGDAGLSHGGVYTCTSLEHRGVFIVKVSRSTGLGQRVRGRRDRSQTCEVFGPRTCSGCRVGTAWRCRSVILRTRCQHCTAGLAGIGPVPERCGLRSPLLHSHRGRRLTCFTALQLRTWATRPDWHRLHRTSSWMHSRTP